MQLNWSFQTWKKNVTGCRQQGWADLGRLHCPEEVLPRGPGGDDRWLWWWEGGYCGWKQRLFSEGEFRSHVKIGQSNLNCVRHLFIFLCWRFIRGHWCSWSKLWSITPSGFCIVRVTPCCTRPFSWGRRSCRKSPSSASLMKSCTRYGDF